MNARLAFWAIVRKDIKTYYLKPPNLSWGLIFPFAWMLMFYLRSQTPLDIGALLPGVVAMSVLFGNLHAGGKHHLRAQEPLFREAPPGSARLEPAHAGQNRRGDADGDEQPAEEQHRKAKEVGKGLRLEDLLHGHRDEQPKYHMDRVVGRSDPSEINPVSGGKINGPALRRKIEGLRQESMTGSVGMAAQPRSPFVQSPPSLFACCQPPPSALTRPTTATSCWLRRRVAVRSIPSVVFWAVAISRYVTRPAS